jgi:hypothetical protein
MFVGTTMKGDNPDRFGTIETNFNPRRLGINIVKTGLWQTIRFDEVLAVAGEAARQLGWRFTKAPSGEGCAT